MTRDPMSDEALTPVSHVLPALADRVWSMLAVVPRTCEELEGRMGLKHQTCSAVLTKLKKDERVEKSGTFRPTSSGRRANVWRVIQP